MQETLGEYVKRMTRQKGISLRELERRSDGRVSGSHLSKIIKGISVNVTVETIVGLALGLEVDPHEVFSIASGCRPKETVTIDPLVLADAVMKIADNPHLVEVVRGWVRMSAKDQKEMHESLRSINERAGNKGKRGRKTSHDSKAALRR
ncbi:MAG TPA: helix-turn-helix domain-containing protein [Blastocatellia bacterium]|nr:helix-turn-helix domain-containing protein [Blastocatellia bacterium]